MDSQHFHYVLTYASQANQADGRYHRITVKLSRPGLKVTHRKGYYAAKKEVTFSGLKEREILEALRAPGNLNAIPVGLSYNAFHLDEDRYQLEVFSRATWGSCPFCRRTVARPTSCIGSRLLLTNKAATSAARKNSWICS